MNIINSLRAEARLAPASGIAAAINYGRGRPGLIPLWAGEGDLATPAFISDAANQALAGGETFYTWQGGIPQLREALARFHTRHFGQSFSADEFIVTGGGMHAISMALQATTGAGDEAVYLSPAWPNFRGAALIAGAKPVAVPLSLTGNGWTCDIEQLEAAISPRTRSIFINSPSNPTGGPLTRKRYRPSLISPAVTICGSSPTKSMRCSTTAARAHHPTWTSCNRMTGSCSSTPSRKIGQ